MHVLHRNRPTSAAWLREEDNLRCHLDNSAVDFVDCSLSMSDNGVVSVDIVEDNTLAPARMIKRVAPEGSTIIHSAE